MAAQIPPPPPGSTPEVAKKKGLHPVAWLAIGCLVFVIIAGVLVTAGGIFVAKKAKDALGDDPSMAAAEMIVRITPELELVDSDREARTLTVRDKGSGTVATFDVSAIESGEFKFESEGKTVEIDGSGESGSFVTVTEEGGEGEASTSTLQIGSRGEIPAEVPIYPGSEPQSLYSMTQGGTETGSYQIDTNASFEDLVGFYEQYADETSLVRTEGQEVATLQKNSADGSDTLQIVIQDQGDTRTVLVTYVKPAS